MIPVEEERTLSTTNRPVTAAGCVWRLRLKALVRYPKPQSAPARSVTARRARSYTRTETIRSATSWP